MGKGDCPSVPRSDPEARGLCIRSMDPGRLGADHQPMTELRIVDSDATSLETRVARAALALGAGCAVARFTYWYTGRPPVHEAVLRLPA